MKVLCKLSELEEEFYCFVELHIEQGPVLDQSNLDLGVVEDIVGIVRWRARFTGEANHAGTTPMHLRKDAFVGLTQFAEKIPTLLKEFGSSAARATIGEVNLEPGYIGVVPASAHFTLDLRDISQSHLNDLHSQLQQHAQMVAEQLDLGFELTPIGELPCTSCDPRIISAIEAVVKKMGSAYTKLPSGATHDALPMSTLCPIGMIFVPSVNGISHSSYEHTEPEHLCLGAQALLETIYTLAQGENIVWTKLNDIKHLALLIIDLQELDVSPNHGALSQKAPKLFPCILAMFIVECYLTRIGYYPLFRSLGAEVIHVRIQSMTADGRDRSWAHKRLGLHVPPNSPLAKFLPGVEPQGDEIILNKTSSDAFHTTILAQLLRNMEIKELVVCGVFTHECVSSTTRSACDLNFSVTVIGDACAATTDDLHMQALEELNLRYARVIKTEALIEELKSIQ